MMMQSKWIRRIARPMSLLTALIFLGGSTVSAQLPSLPVPPSPSGTPRPSAPPSPSASDTRGGERLILLNFRDSPLDQVLEFVADLRGRTLIKAPGVNATVTLKSQTRLTSSEALEAIEAVLAMNNIALVPMGDKFLKVVQIAQARQEGMEISFSRDPDAPFRDSDQLISQIFTLKYIELAEVQAIIQGFLHGYGKIQPLERANSMLITDTEANLARVTEILDFIDQPVESKIETRIYEIRYAKASEIAGRLNELIADSQAEEDKPQIAPATPVQSNIPTPPGVIRARQAQAAQQQAGSEIDSALALAERGIIQGKVRIIADERTNILFVISRAENFAFFDKIVAVLDRPVEPEISVRVVALEYAKAEDIAGILNEFIGAASEESDTGAPAGAAAGDTEEAGDPRSQALRDFIRARTQQRTVESATDEKATIGRLSPNTKILADSRTNSLLLMGRLSDLNALEDIILNLDIMLAQVVIEAVIVEVSLSDDIQSGVDWLQRSLVAYNESTRGPAGGLTIREPVAAFGGGTGNTGTQPIDAENVGENFGLASGLTYYFTFFDLNLDAVVRLVQNSRNSRVLSTPVIVTTDNTEAQITASTQRPVVTTTSTTDGGSIRSSYEYRDIGINLTVTPRINPQRFVVMEIKQTADDVAGEVLIDGNRVPEITKRELSAQIAVQDRETIVLGGLVLNRNQKSSTQVPFLGDIPVLGNLFRFKSNTEERTELVVLITPYVLMTPAEARAESKRLFSSGNARQRDWPTGWSDSEFSRMTDTEKRRYIANWEENRPKPFVRDLSVDLIGNGPDSMDIRMPDNAVNPEAEDGTRSIELFQVPGEEDVYVPEEPEDAGPMPEPIALPPPAMQLEENVQTEVALPGPEEGPVPVSADDVDYSAPIPAR